MFLSTFAPILSANSSKILTQAFKSEVQLLQCTIPTNAPSGVVTRSISGYTLDNSFSKTIMANTLVPADTLPVRIPTEFVAAIPVPASPSGGHKGIPASNLPLTSRSLTPSSVSVPAASPAVRTSGRISESFHAKPSPLISSSNFSTIVLS